MAGKVGFLMRASLRRALASFREKLDSFVFFHLGSDAEIRIEEQGSVLEVSIAHRRVHRHSFTLDESLLTRLGESDDDFEEFMLEQLRRHRRDA